MNKQQTKSNATKNKIQNAYLDLYKTKNINKITIKEITDKIECNRGTFYLYYRDVYDLHDKIKKELITKAQKNILKNIDEQKEISLENIFETLMTFYTENETKLVPLITKDSKFLDSIKEVAKPMASKIFKKDLSQSKQADYLIEYHLSSIFGVLNYWVINKNIKVDELFSLLKQVITNGVFTVMKKL